MKKVQGDTVRWGIIGVGDVCEIKSAPAMQKIDRSSVVAVMRRNALKAEDYARRHGIDTWYDSAKDLINDPNVNAIYIATPPHVHAEYTIAAAEQGKPVYVEKPMARSYQECQDMIEACERHQVPLYVAYYRRKLPNYEKIISLVREGAIGDVRAVDIRIIKPIEPDLIADSSENWRTDPSIAGGGYFYDLASHQLDFLDYLFGPIVKASGIKRNQAGLYSAEDIVMGCFEFENGVLGSGTWCFTAALVSEVEETRIIGAKGQIRFENFGNNQVILKSDTVHESFKFNMPQHVQQPLIQTVVDDLLGESECPSTGVSAARTNWVMEQFV
ncbi:MAG: Gfo/Idh/MocA family oxidoreductase [Saprospiraceae bacterium]|nr:Gfo/Idh/MocA family oxidoreductase [Saprospiraceae bacterium]